MVQENIMLRVMGKNTHVISIPIMGIQLLLAMARVQLIEIFQVLHLEQKLHWPVMSMSMDGKSITAKRIGKNKFEITENKKKTNKTWLLHLGVALVGMVKHITENRKERT